MRRERTEDVIKKRLSATWYALVKEKEVSLALSEALQCQMARNRILEDLLEANKAE